MYSDKVKLNEKPNRAKFRSGDVIIRSEYDDVVIRDNGRAVNRLNNQMSYFDKAHRVIMKDLGKETKILRDKMNLMTTSPRPIVKHNSITKLSHQNTQGKKIYTNKKKQNSDRTNDSFKSLTDKSMYSLANEAKRRYANRITKLDKSDDESSDLGIKESPSTMNIKTENSIVPVSARKLQSVQMSAKGELKAESSMSLNTPRPDGRSDSESVLSSHISPRKGHKGGIHTTIGENNRQQSAASHLSFIEILQKADEAKSKGLAIQDHVPRPKTPELLSNYSEDSDGKSRRKSIKTGKTPKSTLISQHL